MYYINPISVRDVFFFCVTNLYVGGLCECCLGAGKCGGGCTASGGGAPLRARSLGGGTITAAMFTDKSNHHPPPSYKCVYMVDIPVYNVLIFLYRFTFWIKFIFILRYVNYLIKYHQNLKSKEESGTIEILSNLYLLMIFKKLFYTFTWNNNIRNQTQTDKLHSKKY